eukprot:761168-Prymnesium_polylepis.1
MVGGAPLKRTTRARGAGTVVSGGCDCDAPSIASGVLVVGCGGRSAWLLDAVSSSLLASSAPGAVRVRRAWSQRQ